MPKFCTSCGNSLEDTAQFCPECGVPCTPAAPVEQPVQQPTEPSAPQPEQPIRQYAPYAEQQPQQAAWLTPEPVRQAAPQGPYVVHENAGQQPIYARPDDPNVPQDKSRMGLGIAVTVGVVLLIAGIIVLFVIINPFKWFGGVSTPQEILDETVKIYLSDDADLDDITPYCYEYQFLIDTNKRTELLDNIQRVFKQEIDTLVQEYGKLQSVSAKIVKSEPPTDEDREYAVQFLQSNYHTEDIEEFLIAEIEFTIKGSVKSGTIEGHSYFIKVDGKWYILLNA